MLVTVRAKKVSRSDYFVKNGYTYTKVSLFFKGGGGVKLDFSRGMRGLARGNSITRYLTK